MKQIIMDSKLYAKNLHTSIPENKDTFGKFIGKWSLDLTIINFDGTHSKHKGEWHFHRILQGRAIQDIWIIPDLTSYKDNEFHEYGTTIRTFNPKTSKWKAVWVGPIQNQFFIFDVEDYNDEIILTLNNDSNLDMKWRFFDISKNSFKWKSELKIKKHDNWFVNYYMKMARI